MSQKIQFGLINDQTKINNSFIESSSNLRTIPYFDGNAKNSIQESVGVVQGNNWQSFGSQASNDYINLSNRRTQSINLGVNPLNVLSDIESAILRSTSPIKVNETEEITILGERGIWANKAEVASWKGPIEISQYSINEDSDPVVINKRVAQSFEYVQELAIRYLRPPTPPPPGEIVIVQQGNSLTPPAPPLVIRQQPARPDTPEPLVFREVPPQAPASIGRKVITISGRRLPPPPRKVVIERLAPLPAKPQSVLVERWLPYGQVKRRVILQRPAVPDPIIVKPRNVIVQWEVPQVNIKREIKYLGVVRANPAEYVSKYGESLIAAKDLPKYVLDIKTPNGLKLAAESSYNSLHELEGDIDALKLIDLDKEGLTEYKNYAPRPKPVSPIVVSSAFQPTNSSNSSQYVFNEAINSSARLENLTQHHQPTIPSLNLSLKLNDATGVSSNSYINKPKQSPTWSGRFEGSEEYLKKIFNLIDSDNDGRVNMEETRTILLILNERFERKYDVTTADEFMSFFDVDKDGLIDFREFRNSIRDILKL